MKKRIIAIITAFLFAAVSSVNVSAKKTIEDYFAEMEFPLPHEAFNSAPYMALYSAEDLKPIYQRSADIPVAPASLTKLVTASVVLENVSVTEAFTVGSELELVEYDSSRCGIKENMTLSVYELLQGLLMRSGNDAAYTLAVNVARAVSGEELRDKDAVEYFCEMMNKLCRSIGAENSSFATPDGYDADGQLTTLDDLALIASYAMQNEIIAEITSCASCVSPLESEDGAEILWYNTNFFLNPAFPLYDENVFGIKTGTTDDAGKCLITRFMDGETAYIAIVSGCASEGERYMSTKSLIDQLCLARKMPVLRYMLLGVVN